jgi:ectoine hydroxylase-related dioxygenase (phytanoyl-CoA dioxygenase family)
MTTLTSSVVNEDHARQYREEGYFILERVVPEEHVELLRSLCQGFIDDFNREMDERGTDTIGINHRNKRYFLFDCYRQRPELGQFLFSPLMADICRATLGPEAHLFWHQYVVKCADPDTTFSWHQDSGYVHPYANPYLSCWVTLDDVTEENGTVYILPYSRSGIRTWVRHQQDSRTNDLVGYFGSDKGIPVIVPAGSIAVFSSFVFHSSGSNSTDRMRRVFLAQYSGEVIMKEDGSAPWGNTEHFLQDGERVRTG